jgi:hypothetical protein
MKHSYIPKGAREILKSCDSWNEIREACRQQKYTCQLWLFSQTNYVAVLFGNQSTGDYRTEPDAYADYLHLTVGANTAR